MIEKQRKQQNTSEYVSQLIYQRFEDYAREVDADMPSDQADVRRAQERLEKEGNPLLKYIRGLECCLRISQLEARSTTAWLLNLIALVSETQAMMNRETKPTQAEQDELKSRVDAALQTIDEHLAKRIAKLYDFEGHEAMYGAGSTQNHSD